MWRSIIHRVLKNHLVFTPSIYKTVADPLGLATDTLPSPFGGVFHSNWLTLTGWQLAF